MEAHPKSFGTGVKPIESNPDVEEETLSTWNMILDPRLTDADSVFRDQTSSKAE
jgi:hypothetical protein